MQERIDFRQLLALIVISRITISLLVTPLLNDPMTGKDAWLIDLIGTPVTALAGLGLVVWLWSRHPGIAMPALLEGLLGRWVGRSLLLLQLLFLLLRVAIDLREIGDFFGVAFLAHTPAILPLLLVAGLGVWAALAGLEVLARFAFVALPLLTIASALIILLAAPSIEWEAFLPLNMQIYGLLPSFRQSITAAVRWDEIFWLGLALPHLPPSPGIGRRILIASVWLSCIWCVLDVATTGLLGPLQTAALYPYLSVTRLLQIKGLLERLDALMLIIWLMCCTVRTGLLLWGLARIVGALTSVRDRPLVLPLTGIALALSLGIAPSVDKLRHFARPAVLIPFALLAYFLPPLIALPASYIRARVQRT